MAGCLCCFGPVVSRSIIVETMWRRKALTHDGWETRKRGVRGKGLGFLNIPFKSLGSMI
jgi:hypothetical protein